MLLFSVFYLLISLFIFSYILTIYQSIIIFFYLSFHLFLSIYISICLSTNLSLMYVYMYDMYVCKLVYRIFNKMWIPSLSPVPYLDRDLNIFIPDISDIHCLVSLGCPGSGYRQYHRVPLLRVLTIPQLISRVDVLYLLSRFRSVQGQLYCSLMSTQTSYPGTIKPSS